MKSKRRYPYTRIAQSLYKQGNRYYVQYVDPNKGRSVQITVPARSIEEAVALSAPLIEQYRAARHTKALEKFKAAHKI